MRAAKLGGQGYERLRITLALFLIGLALVSRVLFDLPPNFAPIAAIALFAGAFLPKRWALSVPLGAIILSDLFIGLHSTVPFTWGSFVLIALLSRRYLRRIKPAAVTGASLGASGLFFLVSNFGTWLDGRLYEWTLNGLILCYVNALPFLRNTVLGDLFFSFAIFGAYALAWKLVRLRVEGAPALSR